MTNRTHSLAFALLALSLGGPALAVDRPSTYPGCATRSVSVPWGGSVSVDLKDCHSFGLGVVSVAPAHGTATVSGLDVTYTAPTLSPATVTFTYTATGPGGT